MYNSSDASYITATPGHVIAASFVALLILLTLAGNIMVVACFYYYQNLRTICNYFIISLSVADILVALLAMPFWLILQLTDMGDASKQIFTPELYTVWACADILLGTASIMNLIAVSFDRHFAITAPYSYAERFTSRRAVAMIAGVWIYASLLTMFRPLLEKPERAYNLSTVVMGFILPFLIMVVLYARIYFVAISQARRIGGNFAKDVKAAKTIAIVIGAFIICWMPFFAIVMVFGIDQNYKIDLEGYKAIKWMEYLNSCLNPIIYTALNRTYRRSLRKLLTRCCKKEQALDSFNSYTNATTVIKAKCSSPSKGSTERESRASNGTAPTHKCTEI